MTTDTPITFEARDAGPVSWAAKWRSRPQTPSTSGGIGSEDIKVVELHDCFAHNEVITYEGLGLCGEGEAAKSIADGDNTYGGAR